MFIQVPLLNQNQIILNVNDIISVEEIQSRHVNKPRLKVTCKEGHVYEVEMSLGLFRAELMRKEQI